MTIQNQTESKFKKKIKEILQKKGIEGIESKTDKIFKWYMPFKNGRI